MRRSDMNIGENERWKESIEEEGLYEPSMYSSS